MRGDAPVRLTGGRDAHRRNKPTVGVGTRGQRLGQAPRGGQAQPVLPQWAATYLRVSAFRRKSLAGTHADRRKPLNGERRQIACQWNERQAPRELRAQEN